MSRSLFALVSGSLLAASGLAGCDCAGQSPCEMADAPEECGMACDSLSPCPAGYYCEGGSCTADCLTDPDCPGGQRCTNEGRCVDTVSDGGPRPDAPGRDANVICADVDLEAMQVIPSVILIVDQSLSMETNNLTRGVTRWEALEDALVGPNGVAGASGTGPGATGLVFDLQDQVRFGLALYSGEDSMCPILTNVPDPLSSVTTGAYPQIKMAYDAASPIRWTPTHLAMEQVLDQVLASPPPDPVIFILATDGQPNECSMSSTATAEPQVIAQAQRAFTAGIRTYVISLAGTDTALQAHLDQVANAGIGQPPDTTPPATSYAPSDTAGLRASLQTIIGGTLSCTVELNGRVVPELACMGTVQLNGAALTCGDPNGWQLVDETHIELQGAACDALLGTPGSRLTASFPCDAVILI
ncbi:MAG: hypothetical protein AB7S26_39385 [Sandaracinaceae bacterium]